MVCKHTVESVILGGDRDLSIERSIEAEGVEIR